MIRIAKVSPPDRQSILSPTYHKEKEQQSLITAFRKEKESHRWLS